MRFLRRWISKALGGRVTREDLQEHLDVRIDALRQEMLLEQQRQMRLCRREMLGQRPTLIAAARRGPPPERTAAEKGECPSLAECYARLATAAPAAFASWTEAMKTGVAAYTGFPTHSCSVDGHENAAMFGDFIAPYLGGRVLDLGCGPQPVPSYLVNYPPDALYGIDPLSSAGDHPFHFHAGVAEFLPWRDAQFHAVVAATSLDHVLLLDRALEEIHRVLIDSDGVFLAWISAIEGAKPYNPYQDHVPPIDAYHLFHFSREGFEEVTRPLFFVEEMFAMGAPYNDLFYALRPRQGSRR